MSDLKKESERLLEGGDVMIYLKSYFIAAHDSAIAKWENKP